ncbi:hypothetical protein BGZ95_004995, partial [Linnemannia exigua]
GPIRKAKTQSQSIWSGRTWKRADRECRARHLIRRSRRETRCRTRRSRSKGRSREESVWI